MKSILLGFAIIFSSFSVLSQDINGCDGQRYVEDIFDEVTVTADLMFGSGITYDGNNQDLFLDVYEPTGDELEARPVIILAFGGSFINGTRKDIDWLCESYARKGYVAVSIDYRLYDGPLFPFPDSTIMRRVVVKAVGDFKAAIRFMRENADNENTFNIDPNQIIVGGISSGSIAACHTVALDSTDNIDPQTLEILSEEGGIDGNASDNYEYSSEAIGVINFSGGLNMADWLDETSPPLFSVHDEFDTVVPYESGFASISFVPIIFMEGSARLAEVADSLGITNKLITIEGSIVHVSYLFGNPETTAQMVKASAAFVNDEILCPSFISSNEDLEKANVQIYPNPTDGLVSLENSVAEVKVYNNMGQLISKATNQNTLDLSGQNSGVYFVHLLNLNGESHVIKLLVN